MIDISETIFGIAFVCVCVLITVCACVITNAVHMIKEEIEYVIHICMNNRSIVEQTSDYVCKNNAKLHILLEEALRDCDDVEENDDGK